MKKLIIFSVLMLSLVAHAEDRCSEQLGQEEVTGQLEISTDVPNHLKGAMITITLADGSSSSVPAEKFKVVPRKQQFLVSKTERTKTISCQGPINRNRVALLGGYGAQSGLKSSTSSGVAEVESKVGLVGGLQYQRLITDRLSIGGQLQTNKTPSLLIGLDF